MRATADMNGNEEWIADTMRRDAAMIALLAHAQGVAEHLMRLPEAQCEAVVALVAIGQATIRYRFGISPNKQIIGSFDQLLESLSPELSQLLEERGQFGLAHEISQAALTSDRELTVTLRSLYGALASLPRRTRPTQNTSPAQGI